MLTSHNSLRHILDKHFRANPNYQLVLFDRLPKRYQQQLGDLKYDNNHYGVLLSRGTQEKSLKAVDQETALLLFTLRKPGPLPGYVLTKFGKQCNQAVAELVLDEVLEIAVNDRDKFVSGAAAHNMIYESIKSDSVRDRITQLSRDALQYAQTLDFGSNLVLSSRLYLYNTIPVSPLWRSRLGSFDDILTFLEIRPGGKQRALLDRHWVSIKHSNPKNGGWLFWKSRHFEARIYNREPLHRYKLYISTLPDVLGKVWPIILATLTDLRVMSFKIGADVYGLLRPDKFVAYFPSFELLAEAANRLKQELEGSPAQGVPFTAGIDSNGVFSWGMDPQSEQQNHIGWYGKESWRSWITNRLAASLQISKRSVTDVEPWQFALQRLRLDGIDTDTWTPYQAIWQTKASL